MNTKISLQKLIAIIEKIGSYTEGTISYSKEETPKPYRYDRCISKYPTTYNWVVKLFEAAQKEVHGTNDVKQLCNKGFDYRRIVTDEYTITCDFPTYKGQPVGKIGFSKLVLI